MSINQKGKNARGSIEEMLKDYLQFIIDRSCYNEGGGGGGRKDNFAVAAPCQIWKGFLKFNGK